jgi:hypothetical protein
MIGNRNIITSLGGSSEEAANCNLLYVPVRDWCLSLTNWNFARKTAVLTQIKGSTSNTPWTAGVASPPWLYEYAYPADAARILFVFGTTSYDSVGAFTGAPSKFAVATDLVSSVQIRVILTSRIAAGAVYTMIISDPTLWPQPFAQAVVSTLAWLLAMPLKQDQNLANSLEKSSHLHRDIAIDYNRQEGLLLEDTTAEWRQARGLPVTNRRALPNPTKPPTESKNNGR